MMNELFSTAFTGPSHRLDFSCLKLMNDSVKIFSEMLYKLVDTHLFELRTLLGAQACCSGSSFLLILLMAYTIPDLLVPYSIRLMESANFHNSLFVVWAMFLILTLESASSILAHTLDDNEHCKRRKIVQLVQLFWASCLLLTYADNWKVALPLAIILVLSGLRMADTVDLIIIQKQDSR